MPEAQGDSNLTKLPEVVMPDPKQKLEKLPTSRIRKAGFRKQIAGRLVGAAIALSTMGIPADNSNPNPNFSSIISNNSEAVQSLSMQDLEKRAEQIYQIQIASPQEGIVTLFGGTEVKPTEWTKEEGATLTKALDKLPPHFYLPGPKDVIVSLPSLSEGHGYGIDPSKDKAQEEKEAQEWQRQIEQQDNKDDIAAIKKVLGENFNVSKEQLHEARNQGHFKKQVEGALPVEFIILDVIPLNLRPGGENLNFYVGQCYCGISSDNPKVLLSHQIFRGNFDDAFSTIVHELTHRVSEQEDYQFVSDLLGVPENVDFKSFLQENANKNVVYRHQILENAGFNASVVGNKFFYGARNANEFISVASEFYVTGKDSFVKIYGAYIGEGKANKLYDYMKSKIFKGKEYSNDREYFQFH